MPIMYVGPYVPPPPRTPEELVMDEWWDALPDEEKILFNFFLHDFLLVFACDD
jgi:hypothetical protein